MSKIDARRILSLVDLTSLSTTDDFTSINQLCAKATAASVAAVCIYPPFVAQAKKQLLGSAIKIATVSNFPSGAESSTSVLAEISLAHEADEIDVVFPYQTFLAGDINSVKKFLAEVRLATQTKILKVILETGAYPDLASVTQASELVIEAGADFIKTSTGKIATGATLAAATAILAVIKQSRQPCGIKISGGVRHLIQAQEYCHLAIKFFGDDWLQPAHFRIGASLLVDELLLSPS